MHLKSDLVEAYVAKGTSHFISINTIELKDNFYHDYRGVVKLSLAIRIRINLNSMIVEGGVA